MSIPSLPVKHSQRCSKIRDNNNELQPIFCGLKSDIHTLHSWKSKEGAPPDKGSSSKRYPFRYNFLKKYCYPSLLSFPPPSKLSEGILTRYVDTRGTIEYKIYQILACSTHSLLDKLGVG